MDFASILLSQLITTPLITSTMTVTEAKAIIVDELCRKSALDASGGWLRRVRGNIGSLFRVGFKGSYQRDFRRKLH